MTRHTIAPEARDDLQEIWNHIARDNLNAARRVRGRLEETFRMLSRSPLLGEACDYLRRGLRLFSVGNYVVFYEVKRGQVRIVRVLHGARDYEDMF